MRDVTTVLMRPSRPTSRPASDGNSIVNVVPAPDRGCDRDGAAVRGDDVAGDRQARARCRGPAFLVLTHGSKMRGSSSSGMPWPVSEISMRHAIGRRVDHATR